MRNRFASSLPFAAWLIASAALAQPASPPVAAAKSAAATHTDSSTDKSAATTGEVIVTGHATKAPQSFVKDVEKFVHDQGQPGPIGQISRWRKPVCPLTEGLTPEFNDFVTERIKEIAAKVGAPGASDCREGVNVLVAFTTNPDRMMADVRRHHEGLLGFHYVGQTKSLAAFEPPMKSWYVTVTKIAGSDFVMIDQAYAPGPPGSGSHIPPPLRSEFAFALVVVDSNLLEGQAIGPLADRIAFQTLSKPAPRDGCSALPSVMDVLDPKCQSSGSADGLTTYDEAYLKALYAYKGDEMRAFERTSIRKRILKDSSPSAPTP